MITEHSYGFVNLKPVVPGKVLDGITPPCFPIFQDFQSCRKLHSGLYLKFVQRRQPAIDASRVIAY